MKAMLWKELRENFKWAVLAMIGLGLAEMYALNQRQFFNYYVQDSETLCKASFLMATTFGCAAVGLILGLVQVLPEQRRDQWAALIHRPVSRAVIFRGKALAGFFLYLFATIPPFLVCIWYVNTPGHFAAPFVPEMVFPGVADICAGAMYYFAALFVALRRGAWWGSRTFGFLAAVHASFFVATTYNLFYVVVEAAVLMALALFTAAWGAMLTNGSFRAQPWLARVALLAVVFYGVCALAEFTAVILASVTPPDYYYGTDYIVDIDGKPLKQVNNKDASATYFDLAGKPVHDDRLTKGSSYRYQLGFAYLSTYIGDPHGSIPNRSYGEGYRSSRTYLLQSQETVGETWYYLIKQKELVGYKTQSRARIGSIGQDGFVTGYQPVRPLAERLITSQTYQLPAFVQNGQTAEYLDFDQRKVTPVFSEPGAEIFGISGLQSYQQDETISGLVGIALLHEVRVIDKTGKTFATLPYHQDMDRYGTISLAIKPTKDRFYVRYSGSSWIDYETREKMPEYLEEMDLNGTLLNTYVLPPIPPVYGHRTWQQYISESGQTPAFFFGNMIYAKVGAMLGSKHLADRLGYEFGRGWPYTREISIRISVVSFILAALTLGWARRVRFSWERAWAWAGFVLLFNLAGLITFRLVADWPVRVLCPKCGRKRPIDETTCPHCHAAWPVAQRDGSEIFEEKTAPAS